MNQYLMVRSALFLARVLFLRCNNEEKVIGGNPVTGSKRAVWGQSFPWVAIGCGKNLVFKGERERGLPMTTGSGSNEFCGCALPATYRQTMPLFSKLLTFLGLKKREVNVLVVGLDNSGKSSVMNHFKAKDTKVTEIVPTVGFAVEKFTFKNLNVTAFDMSGQGRYRNLWEHYYSGVEAIIFVIDSTDSLRFVVVRDELDMMLKHSDLQDKRIPILFLANKSDLTSSQSSSQISTAIGLSNIIATNPWIIISSNAVQGDGLEEGVDWLVERLSRNK